MALHHVAGRLKAIARHVLHDFAKAAQQTRLSAYGGGYGLAQQRHKPAPPMHGKDAPVPARLRYLKATHSMLITVAGIEGKGSARLHAPSAAAALQGRCTRHPVLYQQAHTARWVMSPLLQGYRALSCFCTSTHFGLETTMSTSREDAQPQSEAG